MLVNGEAVTATAVAKVASDVTGKTYKLTIPTLNGKEGSLSVNGTEAVVEAGKEFAFDFLAPEVTKITVKGTNSLVVEFNEKLSDVNAGHFKVVKLSDNTSSPTVKTAVLNADGKSVTLTLGTNDLTVAEYVLTLVDAGANDLVADVAGQKVIAGTEVKFKPTATELTDVSVPTVVKSSYNTITGALTVNFDKVLTSLDLSKATINGVALEATAAPSLTNPTVTIQLTDDTIKALAAIEEELTLSFAKDAFGDANGKTEATEIKVVSEVPAKL